MINTWITNFKPYDLNDKETHINDISQYLLNRCLQMFKYENLPDTIDKRNLELLLLCNGFTIISKVEEGLYAFYGGLGGEPDAYYMPTIATVSNPALNISENYIIGDECCLILSDSSAKGLKDIIRKYATILAEIDLSIRIATINSRITTLISAGDDNTAKSAKQFLTDIENGKLGIISDNTLLGEETLKVNPYASNGSKTLTELIELRNYYEAEFYKEIGLNQTNNMKRESLNDDEIAANEDTLKPLIDDMLEQRQIGIDEVNKMFNLNITVSLNSSWEDNEIELELEHQDKAENNEMTDEELHEDVETNEINLENNETNLENNETNLEEEDDKNET